MAIRDLVNNSDVQLSLSPAARVNGTGTGTAVDLRGYSSAMVVVAFGTWTDGTHTPSLQHSVDGTSYAAAAATDLDGTFTAVSGTAGHNAAQRIGYIGERRYVRVMMTVTGATTGALSTANIVRGDANQLPLA